MQIRSFLPIALLIALALLFAGCGRQPETPADATRDQVEATTPTVETEPTTEVETSDEAAAEAAEPVVIAYMNGRPMYEAGLERQYNLVLSQYQQIYAQFGQDIRALLGGAAGRELKLNMELEALQRLAGRELLFEEAEMEGIAVTDEETDARFDELFDEYLAEQEMSREDFFAYLESVGTDPDAFVSQSKESIHEQILAQALEEAVIETPEVSDDDVAAFFEENRADYEQEEQIRASHILVPTQTQAEVLAGRLEAGETFAELAQEHSTCPSSTSGGDLGWFGRGQMVEPFEEAAFALEEGETSGIVETQFGFHIIRKTGYRPESKPELEEIVDQVRADAVQAEIDDRFQAWFQERFDAAEIVVEDPLLAAAKLQSEDPERGLEALEALLDDESVDEPYLAYLVAIAYESRRQEAVNEKAQLEEAEEIDAETEAQIAELETTIEEATELAIAYYERALEDVGEDSAIRSRLNQLMPTEAQTPSESSP